MLDTKKSDAFTGMRARAREIAKAGGLDQALAACCRNSSSARYRKRWCSAC
jgi:hypothetical protein